MLLKPKEKIFIKNIELRIYMTGVKITYETLFDLLRREKSRSDLQELEQTFFVDVRTYMQEKKASLEGNSNQNNLSSSAEREKINIQIKNIKKILEELYDLRQKKIINIAIHKTKTDSSLIDTSKMLIEEKNLYEDMCFVLKKNKKEILGKLLRNELSTSTTEIKSKEELKEEKTKDNTITSKNNVEENTKEEVQKKNNKNKVKIMSK